MTFGLYAKDNKFYIGDKPVIIKDNDVIVDNTEYTGTRGLWELITSTNPNKNNFTDDDYINYGNLLIQTNTIDQNNNPTKTRAKSSKLMKWKKLIKPIWEGIKDSKKDPVTGSGLTILPSDPNALLERLDLLIASQKAGHTGVRNELVSRSICDELKRQGAINADTYKKLNSIIKK